MKHSVAVLAVVAALLVSGCNEYQKNESLSQVDQRLVTWHYDTAISNAVIRQHTLFPYQFMPQSSDLNELGVRDLGILAAYFKDRPGTVNVRRGDASEDLYQGRVAAVRTALEQGGVEPERVVIREGLPGGDGIPGESVFAILESEGPQQSAASYTLESVKSTTR